MAARQLCFVSTFPLACTQVKPSAISASGAVTSKRSRAATRACLTARTAGRYRLSQREPVPTPAQCSGRKRRLHKRSSSLLLPPVSSPAGCRAKRGLQVQLAAAQPLRVSVQQCISASLPGIARTARRKPRLARVLSSPASLRPADAGESPGKSHCAAARIRAG